MTAQAIEGPPRSVGILVCPDCFTTLPRPTHMVGFSGKVCGCFLCWHYGLFFTEAGRARRSFWSERGTSACQMYAQMQLRDGGPT